MISLWTLLCDGSGYSSVVCFGLWYAGKQLYVFLLTPVGFSQMEEC